MTVVTEEHILYMFTVL